MAESKVPTAQVIASVWDALPVQMRAGIWLIVYSAVGDRIERRTLHDATAPGGVERRVAFKVGREDEDRD